MESSNILKKILTAQWILMSLVIALLIPSVISWFFYNSTIDLPMGLNARLSGRFLFGYILLTIFYFKIVRSKNNNPPTLFLANTMFLALFLDGFGNAIGLYDQQFFGFYYDKYLHFFAPMILTIGAGCYILSLPITTERKLFTLIVVILLMGIGGSIFEIYEHYSDQLIGTDMVKGRNDTIYDIYLDFAGIFVGGIAVSAYIASQKPLNFTNYIPLLNKQEL